MSGARTRASKPRRLARERLSLSAGVMDGEGPPSSSAASGAPRFSSPFCARVSFAVRLLSGRPTHIASKRLQSAKWPLGRKRSFLPRWMLGARVAPPPPRPPLSINAHCACLPGYSPVCFDGIRRLKARLDLLLFFFAGRNSGEKDYDWPRLNPLARSLALSLPSGLIKSQIASCSPKRWEPFSP